jgi:hypothetical protein
MKKEALADKNAKSTAFSLIFQPSTALDRRPLTAFAPFPPYLGAKRRGAPLRDRGVDRALVGYAALAAKRF